jgi:hypothetical protein
MFRCGFCNSNTSGKPTKVVVETREKEYRHGRRVTTGHETVKEVDSCASCAEEFLKAGDQE